MKHIIILFIVFLTWSCSAESEADISEIEFWNLVADFEVSLKEKNVAEKNITELSRLSGLVDDKMVSVEFFLNNVKFLKAYSSLEDLNEYLTSNFKTISRKNNDYLLLFTDHVLLLEMLGNKSKANEMIGILEKNSNRADRSYALALSLYLFSTVKNYNSLEDHCLARCNFSLYHISKMEFLKISKNFEELECYSKELLNSETMVDDVFFKEYVMAFLGFALKSQSKEAAAEYYSLQSSVIFSKNSYVYARLKKYLNE